MYKDILKKYLPSFLSDTKVFSGIFNAEGNELDIIHSKLDDIEAQFNIDTATWALSLYEKELGIATDYTKSLDYRRSVIKSKWRGTGKLDETLIKMVCESFTNGNADITFDGKINVKFTSVKGIPPNMNDLKNAIEEIKPAYLDLEYIYIYNTYEYVQGFLYRNLSAYTWDELRTLKLTTTYTHEFLSKFTHEQLEVIL